MSDKLNGSAERLAGAIREVFTEVVDGAVEPLRTEMKAMHTDMKAMRTDMRDMEKRLNGRIDTTNQNMQAQFAEQERKIGQMLKGA